MESKAMSVITGLLLLSAISLGYSTGKMQQHFDQASAKHQDTAKNMANPAQIRPINVKDYATGDTETVAAKNYYDNPEGMETQARAAKETDQSAIAATDVHLNKRQTIDANNPAYKTAIGHQANADKILSDSGGRYNCVEVQGKGSQKTHSETCQASNVVPMQCIRYPEVKIIDVPYQTQETFKGQLSSSTPTTGKIIPPESGTIVAATVQLENHGNNIYLCKRNYWGVIAGHKMSSTWPNCGGGAGGLAPFRINGISVPVQAGIGVNFQLQCEVKRSIFGTFRVCSDHVAAYRPWNITMTVTRYKKEARITWKDTCQNVNKNVCVKTKEQCVEPGGTRNISGVNVTQDCWKYDLAYTCGYKKHDNCDDIARRCNFISQKCIEEAHGYCYAYERTYKCSEAVEGPKELICGDPNSIEFKQKIEQGTGEDFAKAVSGLAGVSAAGNNLKKTQDQVNIMKGKSYNCGEAGMGLYDCCASGGNMLRHCSDSEKSLQEARGKKLAVFTGRHCAKKALGVCLVYHQGWCVFDSKLMRIIHEQGRRQLNISFGSGEEPNCRGLTPDELQKIDFSRVDFSEIHDEMTLKKPSDTAISDAMAKVFQKDKETPSYNKRKADQPL